MANDRWIDERTEKADPHLLHPLLERFLFSQRGQGTRDDFGWKPGFDWLAMPIFTKRNKRSPNSGPHVVLQFADDVVLSRADFVEVVQGITTRALTDKLDVIGYVIAFKLSGRGSDLGLPTLDKVSESVAGRC
jgi:hypothetical protein